MPELVLPRSRPLPPERLADSDRPGLLFEPADELAAWLWDVFLDPDGPLANADHAHLRDLERSQLCALWTNVECITGQRQVAATAEMPKPTGKKWGQARGAYQLLTWFGEIPVFLITADAVLWAQADDRTACARADHELYHCSFKQDEHGQPRYGADGAPLWELRGHDVEQFVGVTRRWGAAASGVTELVAAALQAEASPWYSDEVVAAACGTCGGRF